MPSAVLAAHIAELGRDDHVFAPSRQRAPDQTLVGERAVHVRGVEQVDAQLDGAMDGRDSLGFIARTVELAHPHAAKAERRHLQTLRSQLSFCHGPEHSATRSFSPRPPPRTAK
jgi:hypothetical protein